MSVSPPSRLLSYKYLYHRKRRCRRAVQHTTKLLCHVGCSPIYCFINSFNLFHLIPNKNQIKWILRKRDERQRDKTRSSAQVAQIARPAEQITYKSSILDVVMVHLLHNVSLSNEVLYSLELLVYMHFRSLIIYYSGDLFVFDIWRLFAIVCDCRIEFNLKPQLYMRVMVRPIAEMSKSLTFDLFLEFFIRDKEKLSNRCHFWVVNYNYQHEIN